MNSLFKHFFSSGLDDNEDISSAYMVQEIDDEDGKKTIFSLNISGTPAAEVDTFFRYVIKP